MERSNAFDCPNEFALLCAGHCTHHKGEPIFFNYGSQGKSQAQPDGGEGCSGITTGVSVTVPRKAVALLRQGTAKVRGDLPVRARRPDVYYVHLCLF